MEIKSLGLRSERIFTNFDGEVEDRGTYNVVRSLTNPNYFWGNLLIFDHPPRKGDFARWTKIFNKEFTNPAIYHKTFAWESPSGEVGDLSEFTTRGYELDTKVTLSSHAVHQPPKVCSELIVRPITGPEWERVIEVQVESAGDGLPKNEWQSFYSQQSFRYRKMIVAGKGQWFGGFIDNQLVASLGIFHEGEMGRFQTVNTHPAYTRRGICGTLVYKSALFAFEKMSVKELVMCADPHYHAAGIYQSVGFKIVETQHGVNWWDRSRAQ